MLEAFFYHRCLATKAGCDRQVGGTSRCGVVEGMIAPHLTHPPSVQKQSPHHVGKCPRREPAHRSVFNGPTAPHRPRGKRTHQQGAPKLPSLSLPFSLFFSLFFSLYLFTFALSCRAPRERTDHSFPRAHSPRGSATRSHTSRLQPLPCPTT